MFSKDDGLNKFVFLDTQSTPRTDFGIIREILESHGIAFVAETVMDKADVIRVAKDADGIALTFPEIDKDVIRELRNCRVIIRNGIGYDNVDIKEATKKGIAVCNIPDYCTEEVASHALALMLDVCRKTTLLDRQARKGNWNATYGYDIRRLSELTVGLVSFGKIAQKLASYCRGIGMEVVCYDPYVPKDIFQAIGVKQVDIKTLFGVSDIISIHAPLVADTQHLIRRETINMMKDQVMLINTSRGPIIYLDDLIKSVHEGKVAAAGLDVFEGEPLTDLCHEIYRCENIVITPHAAYYSHESAIEQITKVALTAVDIFEGNRPRNILNDVG